jgi:RNA polymerase-binding protein DksA
VKPARKAAKKTTKKASKKAKKTAAKKTTKKTSKKAVAKKTTEKAAAKKNVAGAAGKAAPEKAAGPARPKGLKIGAGGKSSRAEELRSILEAKRTEILQEIRRARQDSVKTDRESYAEVGDLVSASVEKERAFEYGEIGVQLLREIDTALQKLKEGTFGICEMCAKPIGVRRLKVMPSARLCIKCKSMEEASGPGARSRSLTQED